jgi:hypothetical protein
MTCQRESVRARAGDDGFQFIKHIDQLVDPRGEEEAGNRQLLGWCGDASLVFRDGYPTLGWISGAAIVELPSRAINGIAIAKDCMAK